jgi:hypothetical protein
MKKKFIEQITIWAAIWWLLTEGLRVIFGFLLGKLLWYCWEKWFSKKTSIDNQEDPK